MRSYVVADYAGESFEIKFQIDDKTEVIMSTALELKSKLNVAIT